MLRQAGIFGVMLLSFGAAGTGTPVSFPYGVTPFSSIYYIGGPDGQGNRLVEGRVTDLDTFAAIEAMTPGTASQLFADPYIELAPGQYFTNVYVPAFPELRGDFGAVHVNVLDPFTGYPFAGNIIPSSRLGGIFAFEIRPVVGYAPGPSGSIQADAIDLVPPFSGIPLEQEIVPVLGIGLFSYLAPAAPVPEPGISSLLALAGAVLSSAGAMRRRRS